jgi:hypothetical protein
MEERPVYVRFEYREVEDRAASIKEGHYVGKDVIFAMITPPGGNLVVDRVADEWLASKRGDKFYPHYEALLKAWKEGAAEPEFGTSLKSWPVASPAQIAACFSANIKTVEDLATAPAQALQRIGMGAVALQQKAAAWLQSAQDKGQTAEKVATLTRDVEALTTRNAELSAQVEALLAAQGGRPRRAAKEQKDIEIA